MSNPTLRKTLAANSVALFGAIYFPHYFTSEMPDFHFEIYGDLQDDFIKFLEIIGFRGSAKSTIAALIFVAWVIVFKKRHFILMLADTAAQSKLLIANLIAEFESNELLRQDFGSLFERPKGQKKKEWTASNILFNNSVRVMARSRGQKVRGLRHLQYRPDLIIADDIENTDDVDSQEQRDKLERWFITDVLPCLDPDIGKVALLGNLLHQDSLVSRIKRKILAGKIKGVLREYPLFVKGQNMWPSRFTPAIILELQGRGLIYYAREMLLQIIATSGQPIKKILHYTALPLRATEKDPPPIQTLAICMDLAISKRQTADSTSISVGGMGQILPIYMFETLNGKGWGLREAAKQFDQLYKKYLALYPHAAFLLGVENVQYQAASIEFLQTEYGLPIIGIEPKQDKRARLENVAPHFDVGNVLFPEFGMEHAEQEILGFGIEPHDDDADSVEMVVRMLTTRGVPSVYWI